MTTIVDGNAILREIQESSRDTFAKVAADRGIPPRVAVIQAGDDPGASLYTRHLKRNFETAGVAVDVHKLPVDATLPEAQEAIGRLSADPAIHGIQIQTPTPEHLPLRELVGALDPEKDLDGIHPLNAGLLAQGTPSIVPATPLGGLEILLRHKVPIEGARAVVIGRSAIVGRPMALLLLARHATVTICHTRTRDLPHITREAEILACAAGRAGLVGLEMVRPGAAVIDFGLNVVDGTVLGDVAPEAAERAGLFTPVPGGTGPVTSAMLLKNALVLYQRALGVEP
ncbi:MAG: bifunctional 5,10-methylenetetrahydrofolate dehydrogenase/5,10-methenyltetrahydrofolate cyclohydrolase [Chloroflexi bacterium]|nr:bifunctional 5,10-methylenetetrahydrofolate dehydrogenase/5,10-methenyltetrahydrofolate cyclohydrolase [Chloroflexota bacterium]